MASSSSAARANLGPLTTTFTPPATCSTIGVVSGYPNKVGWRACQCITSGILSAGGKVETVYHGSIWNDYTCRPSSTQTEIQQTGFYSPGIICPIGHYQACTSAVLSNGEPSPIKGSSFSFAFALEAGETAIGCCPTSHICSGSNSCVSTASTGAVFKLTQCAGNDFTGTSTFQYTVSSPATFTILAPMAQLVYKPSDLQYITVEHPTVTVTSNAQSGLSTGDKAGIGVGVTAIVLIAIAAGLGWLFFRRRKSVSPAPNQAWNKTAGDYDSRAAFLTPHGGAMAETGGTQMNELGGSPQATELHGNAHRSELPERNDGR